MINADTITDTQIRELMRLAKIEGHKATVYVCRIALDDGVVHQPAKRIRDARARCAELLNARGESDG